jgi:transposase
MPATRILQLTDEQRAELHQAMLRDPKAYIRERAAALLKIAAGESPHAVALTGLYHSRDPDTVYTWLNRYEADGVSGLVIRPGRGRKPAYHQVYPTADAAKEAVLHLVRRDPRQFEEPRSRWTLAALQRVCAWLGRISQPGVSQVLKRLHVTWKRGRSHVHSPDPHYVAKLLTIHVRLQEIRLRWTPRLVLLFQDEMTYERHPSVANAYAASGREQTLASRSHASATQRRITATLDACTGRVIFRQAARIQIPTLCRFYEQVCAAYADEPTLIYLVQDNWPVHLHPDVLARLMPQTLPFPRPLPPNWPTKPRKTWPDAERLPITLLMLPTYAPWTNPIEKLWRWLRQEVLHLHRHADDWAGLQTLVTQFLEQFAHGSRALLRYVGLSDLDAVYQGAFATSGVSPPLPD